MKIIDIILEIGDNMIIFPKDPELSLKILGGEGAPTRVVLIHK